MFTIRDPKGHATKRKIIHKGWGLRGQKATGADEDAAQSRWNHCSAKWLTFLSRAFLPALIL